MKSDFSAQTYWENVNSGRRPVEYLMQFYRDMVGGYHPTKEHSDRAEQREWMREQILENGWQTLLDAGCGPGFWFQLWDELKLEVSAVDRAKSAIPRAELLAKTLGADVPVFNSSLASLPFEDKTFDVAVTVKVLLHTPPNEILSTLKELSRVSRRLMLLEFVPTVPMKLREHVFQHDYEALFAECGCTISVATPFQGHQTFYVLESR